MPLQWAEDYGCYRCYVSGVGWITVQNSLTRRDVVEVTIFGERLKREFTNMEEAKKAALRVALARVQKAVVLLKEVAPPLEAQPVTAPVIVLDKNDPLNEVWNSKEDHGAWDGTKERDGK
jgi:hypothetical protein